MDVQKNKGYVLGLERGDGISTGSALQDIPAFAGQELAQTRTHSWFIVDNEYTLYLANPIMGGV
jgi:hypothetical protein